MNPRPFAVFDIDGTLIRWQLYHAIVDSLARQGVLTPELYEKVRTARFSWKQRTHEEAFKDYESALVDAYNNVITLLTLEEFNQAVQAAFDEYKDQVYRYSRGLIQQLKEQKYLLFAISGSHNEVVEKVARYYDFDDFVGTVYERRRNKFTGKKVAHLGSKHIILEGLVKKHEATYKGSLAIGDSESDISMLEAVEQPIAFNPTKKLYAHAQAKGWNIVIERKNMIYELKQKNGRYTLA